MNDYQSLAVHHTEPGGDPFVLGRWHKDRVTTQGYIFELKLLLKQLYRHPSGQKFIIFGRARSGTTLLTRLLDEVGGIDCDGEVLHYDVLNPVAHVCRLATTSPAQAYGCKVLSYQLYLVQKVAAPDLFFKDLHSRGFKIIHLVRNTLPQCLSLATAQVKRAYVQDSKVNKTELINLDPDKVLKLVRWNEALLEYERYTLSDIEHLSLSYEQHLEDSTVHQATVDSLCQHIGVQSSPVKATIYKMAEGKLGKNIQNFEEIVAKLQAAGFEHLVRDYI